MAPVKIAVSSRAIFKLDTEHGIYTKQGQEAYDQYYLDHEEQVLEPGVAFPFIRALEKVNQKLLLLDKEEKNVFEVVIMSHNSASAGIRLLKSIEHHGLNIQQMCLTDWGSVVPYLGAYNVDLLLTSYVDEVKEALRKGFAAAVISPQTINEEYYRDDNLRVAFDCDAVLFSNESDKIYQEDGLEAFYAHEAKNEDIPINEGPLKRFASALGSIQTKFKAAKQPCPSRTYIVTARGADRSSGVRALKTLRAWGLEINGLNFLAGQSKGPVLKAIGAHFFFDDSSKNIASSMEYSIPAGHVDWGVDKPVLGDVRCETQVLVEAPADVSKPTRKKRKR